ncbi:MAG: hypothetical protein RID09_02005 [Coleofasciculus sp. G1-WW12-02]|uniref:hypothetical protein n=1 Tax=Coleofasciculus sp. G1-WW12-02 TaxID=3068483 RepID=UPI0032FAA3DD
MNNWTRKHNKFSVQNRLTPTARELWQWLLDEMPEGSNEIIDLRDKLSAIRCAARGKICPEPSYSASSLLFLI